MDMGGVRHLAQRDHGGPRAARSWLPEDLGPPAPLRAERAGHRRLQKKGFPAELDEIREGLPAGTEIELWWQDEARVGQKNSITRRWAKRGTRPRAPHDQRTKWAYIFGAICPKKGKGAALVMPWCDTPAMAAHLAEISAAVDPGAHAVLMLDQAGWHMSAKLAVPANITLLPLDCATCRLEILCWRGQASCHSHLM